MEEKLKSCIHTLYFIHDLKHCEEQRGKLFNICKAELERLPELEKTLNEANAWNYFIIQMLLENF